MTQKTDLKEGEFMFKPRGLGNNWLPCFICGHKRVERCQADMAVFVDPKLTVKFAGLDLKDKDGKPVAEHPVRQFLFENDIVSTLDYRPSEPNWLQIKLGACGEHEPNLELLCALTYQDGMINKSRLSKCIPKRKCP